MNFVSSNFNTESRNFRGCSIERNGLLSAGATVIMETANQSNRGNIMTQLIAATKTSHAKAILIGEHAVVYTQPAIAIPIPTIRLRAELTPRVDGQQLVTSAFFNGALFAAAGTRFAGIATLIRQLLIRFDGQDCGFNLNIISDLPPERGMGSSAATAVAITRAFYAAFNTPLDHATLLRWADVSERIIHGNPSGIDAATASADKPQWIVRGKAPRALTRPTRGVLVIADSGIQGQTGQAVAHVATAIRQNPVLYDQITALGQMTRHFALAIADNDIEQMGTLMTSAQHALAALGVSNDTLDHLVAVATHAGALGAKLTGSGMGGCMLALARDKAAAAKIAAALTAAGATASWEYDFTAPVENKKEQ